MKIKWLGHSSFLITSEEGVKIITDPYTVIAGVFEYGSIEESADIVTTSHKHGDHGNASAVKGKPVVVDQAGARNIKGVDLKGITSYHDETGGKQRGMNIIFCFTVNGVKICHLGDLGHQLEPPQINEAGKVDILLIPVGGKYTIDAKGAGEVCEKLNPRMVIPMHYKTAKCGYEIAGVEDFLKGRKNVRRLEVSEIEIRKGNLPADTETVVLKHAL